MKNFNDIEDALYYKVVYEAVGTVGGERTPYSYYLGKGLN